jgi:hypothetical protein
MKRLAIGVVAAGLVLSACFFSTFDLAGRRCDANKLCPDGLVCDPSSLTCVHELGPQDLGQDLAATVEEDLAQPIVCNDPPDAGADYVIRQLPSDAVLSLSSGLCTEPIWSTVEPIVFTGPNFTNNTQTCRLLWQRGQPDVVFGCCQIGDKDLQGTQTTNGAAVYNDDGIEYLLKGNLAVAFDSTTSKIQINLLGYHADHDYPDGMLNSNYNGHVIAVTKLTGTLNDASAPDTGYSIKWRADIDFVVTPPHLGKCDFMISDVDVDLGTGSLERQTWAAYGTVVNHPTDWGTCLFSCATP